MSFKIWGINAVFNEDEIQNQLLKLGVRDTISLIGEVSRKGCVSVGGKKIFALR